MKPPNASAPAVNSAICASSDSTVGPAAIAAEINNITVNVLAIQDKFDAILSIIDSENLDSRKFSPAWGQRSQNWTHLLCGSRKLASDIIVYCNELTDVWRTKVQESAPLNASSEAMAQGFDELYGDFLNFYKLYQDFAVNQSISTNSTIMQLQTKIDSLRSEIKTITNSGLPAPTDSVLSFLMPMMDAAAHHGRTLDLISAHVPEFAAANLDQFLGILFIPFWLNIGCYITYIGLLFNSSLQ
ncbi:hypothetical protein B0H16DRAFT_1893247 [Mycena metata]|uniref:Uncharacterized protein n=1 Tax=Mycena metata TaxID=1033252 RepID=A0AAD7HZN7_9AGAR|nr:hypothetical protein B0H16DRAFT_1893247 [Mycena metata]